MGIAGEARNFLYACLLGAGLGLFYDVFRAMRLIFKVRWAVFVQDIIFWTGSALATLAFLLDFCSGRVRAYALLGEGLGFLLYHFTAGEVTIRLLRRVFQWVNRFFVKPIRYFLRFISHKISFLFGYMSQYLKRLVFPGKFHLQLRSRLLYNKHNKQMCQNKGGAGLDESEKK